MTIQLDRPAPGAEFPTLDLAELDDAPSKPAVYLRAFEHHQFPAALAVALPTVVHATNHVAELHDEHEFIDAANGSAVRLVLTFDFRARQVRARVAEAGPLGLWDRIVAAATQWNQDSRPPADRWRPAAMA